MLPQNVTKHFRTAAYDAVPDEHDHDPDGKDDGAGHVRVGKALPSFLWLYLSLSAFCGFVVAIAMVNLFPGDAAHSGEGRVGNARLHQLLKFPREKVVFSPIDMFQIAPTPKSDAAWEAFLGPSLGQISLDDPSSYGLPPGSDGHVYQTSLAHQIQCLYLIRKVYWGSPQGGLYNVSAAADPPSAFVAHTNHCFDYLLQSVRCAADVALESQLDASGNFVGWGVPHTCARWESVMDFLTKYKHREAEKAQHDPHDDDEDE